jgi:hypothetical protein
MKIEKIKSLFKQETFFSLLCFSLVVAIMADTSIVKLFHLTVNPKILGWALSIFIPMSILIMIMQFLSFEYVNRRQGKTAIIRTRFGKLSTITGIVQLLSSSVIVYIILEMLLIGAYTTATLIFITSICYFFATYLIILLGYRMWNWFRLNRNLSLLLYGVAASMLAANLFITVMFVDMQLLSKPRQTPPHIGFFSPFFTQTTGALNILYVVTSILSFITMWLANVVLLKNSSRKVASPYRSTLFWFMVSIPLIYFVTQFQPIFYGLFSTLILWEPLLFALILTLIFAWSKTIGGILFYTAFRLSARKFPRNSLLRENLTISAIGMLMIFASNQAVVLVSAPYPPFGVLTVSLVGLSSYFLYLGVYSSAATIAQDEELRRFIKKAAERNVDLLQSMGSAHAEQEILQKIVLVTKTHRSSLEDKTGIGLQPDENEIRDYLEEVIKELKRNK